MLGLPDVPEKEASKGNINSYAVVRRVLDETTTGVSALAETPENLGCGGGI